MKSPSDPLGDPRLDELFVRYWDDALTDAEAAELEQRLLSDPSARERFRLLSLQAVTAAELTAVARAEAAPPPEAPHGPRRTGWSRRRVLRFLGAGVAASVAAGVIDRYWPRNEPLSPVQLTAASGLVKVLSPGGQSLPPRGAVPAGGTVSTHGPNSSAVLTFPDGSVCSLAGDSVLTVADNGQRLALHQGNATADVRPQSAEAAALALTTAVVTLTGLSGTVTTVGHSAWGASEVGVLQGIVTASAPTGQPMAVVREGEVLTVAAGGEHHKQPLAIPPDRYELDLARPLPDSWAVGNIEATAVGPALLPRLWFDPYHQAEMYQIRSNSAWTRGFFRLYPESTFRVRYWVDRPGPGQLCVCVRSARARSPKTGVLECNGAFLDARPRQWQELTVRVTDMLDNIHTPEFGPPWVGFLLIFNTYEADLGLKVAACRVSRPGGADAPH